MNYCELKGQNETAYTSFDAIVSISGDNYEEYFNVLDGENAGRTGIQKRMIRDIIGTYLGHKITFFRSGSSEKSVENFDRLWEWLKDHSVDDFVYIRAADNQTAIEYEAYYTSGSRKLSAVAGGINFWDEISVNFIPMEPQITP